MPFLGNKPTNNFTSFEKQDITGDGSSSYTLAHAVNNEKDIDVFINFIHQEPTTAYQAAGTTLTLTESISSADDCYIIFRSRAILSATPPDGSVNSAKLDTNIAVAGDLTVDTTTLKVDSSNNRVGIGTASPSALTTIKTASNEEDAILIEQSDGTDVGSLRINGGAFILKGKSSTAPVQLQTHDGNEDIEVDPDGFIKMETSGSERMRIMSDGKIGIGTSSPQEQLHVYGGSTAGLRVSGGGNNNMKCEIGYDNSAGPYIKAGSSGQTDLHIYVDNNSLAAEFRHNTDFYSNDGTVHSLSDIRVKKDVADLTDGLDIVKQLKPRTFKYTEDSAFYNEKTKDKIKYGFVANEVEVVAPQYTDTGKGRIGGKEVDDFKTLSATKMIPMLVKAIQELSVKNDALEARIKKLEGK